jgi:hypothetical protein
MSQNSSRIGRTPRFAFILALAVIFVFGIVVRNYLASEDSAYLPHGSKLRQVRWLGQVLDSYAKDNNGKYPTGKSSTDIFQQLLDQNYINDPTWFYFSMPGKTKPASNKLNPENVCFDVTDGVLPDDSESLPLVVTTGYKIDYIPGGKAHPLVNSYPQRIDVYYRGNQAFHKIGGTDGIPLIDPAFDPKGRTYRQLTPDGPLP